MSISPTSSPSSSSAPAAAPLQGPPTVLPSPIKDTLQSLSPPPDSFGKRAARFLESVWKFLLKHTFLGRFFSFVEKPLSPDSTSVVSSPTTPLDLPTTSSTVSEAPTEVSKKVDERPVLLTAPLSDSALPLAPTETLTEGQPEIIEGKIYIQSSVTGYIGIDEHFGFRETLQLSKGEYVQVKPDDFYVRVNIRASDGTSLAAELPSSLFSQAREGNTVSFILANQRYKLELSSFMKHYSKGVLYDIPFDECFQNLKDSLRSHPYEFLYPEDVPSDYFLWKCPLIQIYLSPATLQIEVGKQEGFPVNFEKLQIIGTHQPPQILERTETEIVLEACGKPKIDLILDRHFLYIHIIRKPHEKLKDKRIIQLGIVDGFMQLVLDQPLRPSDLETSLSEEGKLTLRLLKGKILDIRR